MSLGNYKTIMTGPVMSKIYALVLDGKVSACTKAHGDALVEMVGSYTYLGVLFLGLIFTMHPAMQTHVAMGYVSLTWLERKCFHSHVQDP